MVVKSMSHRVFNHLRVVPYAALPEFTGRTPQSTYRHCPACQITIDELLVRINFWSGIQSRFSCEALEAMVQHIELRHTLLDP